MIILGFDPGGENGSGAALWRVDRPPLTTSHRSVDSAFDWFLKQLGDQRPAAAGIDTLLCWQTGPGGWREPDKLLRKRYPKVMNSVVAPNSLFGSMAVQGMAMAIKLRQYWPEIHLNETHPKVLYFDQAKCEYEYCEKLVRWLCRQDASFRCWKPANEHEWDALMSAWATYQGVTHKWTGPNLRKHARNPRVIP